MSTELWSGMTPPAILRARPMESAEEVLVCSYTADLAFFESTCLFSARQAMRARVTLVHDDAAGNPTSAVRHAGRAYTAVPVRCHNNREFHPKLLVIAGLDEAVVAIGSGNMTQSGWHYNGEIWATVAARVENWPETFHVIADWLGRLPEVVHMDPFGVSRVQAVAKLLKRHTPVTAGPQVVHNLDAVLLNQLPASDIAVDELVVASPFLDGGAEALHAVSRRFRAARTTFALTKGAKANPATLAAWAGPPGHQVHRVTESRYLHGKLVEWASGDRRMALIGSPNITRAALLDTTAAGGNCELALISEVNGSLAPDLDDEPLREDEFADAVHEWEGERLAVAGPRLLRVLVTAETVTVWLTRSGDPSGSVLLVGGEETGLALHCGATPDSDLVELTAPAALSPGTFCSVRLPDGRVLGPIPATGSLQVQQRPGAGSPLDARSLPRVLGDPEQNRKLLELLSAWPMILSVTRR